MIDELGSMGLDRLQDRIFTPKVDDPKAEELAPKAGVWPPPKTYSVWQVSF